ncbi:MAG: DUF192 domain-containing protein [Elusimicrobiaceae bacterium]|nr:DUF192 domain-containing protein [Elusimicrobiaceae bacterium]
MTQCVLRRSGEVIAAEVETARTFLARLAGLMFRKTLPEGKALLLFPCPQIHTCFMRFAIDAVFCDKKGKVLYIKEQMKPWQWGRFVRGSYYTLELPGGSLQGRVHPGDELLFVDRFNPIKAGDK